MGSVGVTGRHCAACGVRADADARFCSGCGVELPVVEVDTAAPREERRLVTVLFSDAAGYTQLAESLDPELVRELMGLIYQAADEIVSRYGGRVDKLMGDAVLAVFGDPVSHEDDAERAVRAALDLHEAVAALRPTFEARAGQFFEMHSGINSGVIVTSDLEEDRSSGPLGDMVNVASRLQSLAESGEILVGPDTAALVAPRFLLTDLGPRQLKGRRDAVAVARVEGPQVDTGASRRYGSFVGRHEELGVLLGGIESLRDNNSSVVTICGEAGAGKTRLLQEFRSHLDPDVRWLEGRAYPYTVDTPYAPVVDLLNRVAGIDENRSVSEVRGLLQSMVDALLPGDEMALDTITHLYGIDGDLGTIDLEAFQERLRSVLTQLLDRFAADAPTVVCFQDLHWVDPSTAGLLRDLVAEVSSPVLTVCNFRPGFELGVEGERALQLGVLSPRQTRDLLMSILDGDEPPDELVEWVCARSDGNPFFVEEIMNSLLDRAVLVQSANGWELSTDLDDDTVPPTIQGLLASRIDALDVDARRVLREASVVGREFLHRIVQSVTERPAGLDESLAGLADADFIRRHNLDPELEYIFKHALTQEVAYEGLLLRDRQQLHERVARSIEEQMKDRLAEFVETLAYHYHRSGHAPEAVEYLRRSGRKALERYALPEADRQYAAAYELLTSDEVVGVTVDAAERDRLLLETILEWSEIFYYTGEVGAHHELFQQHLDLADRVANDALTARWKAWSGMISWLHLGQNTGPTRLLEEALELGERCGDLQSQGYAMAWLTWTYWTGGRASDAVALWPRVEELLPHIDDAKARQYIHIKALGGVAVASAMVNDRTLATQRAEELLRIGRESGNRRATAMGHGAMISVHMIGGDGERALEAVDASVSCNADPVYAITGELWATGIAIMYSSPEVARGWYERAQPQSVEMGQGFNLAFFEIFAAQLDVLEGRLSRGMKRLEELSETSAAGGMAWAQMNIDLFIAFALARAATGEVEASSSVALKNPRFVMKYALSAGRKARKALEEVIAGAPDRQMWAVIPMAKFELAKLARHDKRSEEARQLLADVIDGLSATPGTALSADAQQLLGEIEGAGAR